MYELLDQATNPDLGALICDDAHVTRAELKASIDERCEYLASIGVNPGDRILIESGRKLDYWRDLLACLQLGALIVPVAARQDHSELASLCKARWLLGANRECTELSKANADRTAFDTWANSSDWAAILVTSGSTGKPKGVPVTATALLGNMTATIARTQLNRSHTLAIAMPGHFTSALCHFLACIHSGAAFIATDKRLMPSELPSFLAGHQATAFGAGPLQLGWLAESAPVPGLRWMMSSGDRLSVATERKLLNHYPAADLFVVYGLTEVAGRCTIRRAAPGFAEGTVGTTIDGIHARIDALPDNDLDNHEGEIVVEGPLLFAGYINESGGPSLPLTEFKTGDLGTMDAGGILTVEGRRDDVFKCAGQKVSSQRIVEALRATVGVVDAAVLAEPHASLGMVPVAFVSLAESTSSEPGPVLAALRVRLPANHIPHEIVMVSVVPRTGSGKIDRQALVELRHRIRASA